MVKVLQIVGGLRRAGAETWLLQVARRIDRSAVAMDFLVHGSEEGEYEGELRDLGCGIVRTPMPAELAAYARSLGEALDRSRYHVVHSHLQHFSGVTTFLARRHGVETRIVHSHLDTPPGSARGLRSPYTWTMERLIRRYATHRIGVSQRAAVALFGTDWATQPNTAVMSCGIDLAPFMTPATKGLRQSLGLHPSALVMGHVGRFVEQKNHELVVAVAADVMSRDPNARLLLVGEGPLRPRIEQRCSDLGIRERTVFAGSRPDVPELLKSAIDVFLFPSRYEGLGLAVIEAQAAGVPSVISDVVPPEVEVLPELIQWQSLEDSPSAWAAAVERVKRRHGAADSARRIWATSFNIERSVAWLHRLYSGRVIAPSGVAA